MILVANNTVERRSSAGKDYRGAWTLTLSVHLHPIGVNDVQKEIDRSSSRKVTAIGQMEVDDLGEDTEITRVSFAPNVFACPRNRARLNIVRSTSEPVYRIRSLRLFVRDAPPRRLSHGAIHRFPTESSHAS